MNIMGRYLILIVVFTLLLAGCEGMQVNIPVEVKFQSIPQEEAALLVLVENKSALHIEIKHPIQSGMLRPSQNIIFPFPMPGNYTVVVAAYEESHNYRYNYQHISTIEIPVFLNGYDIIRAGGNLVGCYLEVTNGMLLPGR